MCWHLQMRFANRCRLTTALGFCLGRFFGFQNIQKPPYAFEIYIISFQSHSIQINFQTARLPERLGDMTR